MEQNYTSGFALFGKCAIMAIIAASSTLSSQAEPSLVTNGDIVSSTVEQSKKAITGIVIDETGQPVIGATVLIKGTANGAITDGNGKFEIKNVSNTSILEISFLGYEPATLTVGTQSNVQITLKTSALVTDDVVVIGYGTQRKRDLTGSISSVSFGDSPVSTYSSISQALAGKAAGLKVQTISAQPGGQTNFNIRGAASTGAGNDPLIIIDGFPISGSGEPGGERYNGGPKDNVLATLNPNDIESITVLKDASATAIYGSRAGHGVIIVTTKRGKEGRVTVQYSGNVAWQTHARKPEFLNAEEFMTGLNSWDRENFLMKNKMYPYGAGAANLNGFKPSFSDQQIKDNTVDTNWYDEVTRNGFQHQHSISLNGGSKTTQYLVSMNYFDQDGAVRNSSMDRFNARVNLDQQIGKMFKAGINLTFNRNRFDNAAIGDGANENAGLLISASNFAPIIPVYDKDGKYSLNPMAAYLPNPSSLLNITDKTNMQRLLGTSFVEFKPIKDLTFKATAGIDRNYNKRSVYLPKTTLYGQKEGGKATIAQSDKNDYLFEVTGNYNVTLGKHRISALLGYSFQDFNSEGFNAWNSKFLIDGFLHNNLGAGEFEKPGVGSWANSSQMASLFARANYTFDDRYYLTATFRRDGASNLAEGNKWGNFPSVALAWRFSEEKFLEGAKNVLTNAKLRLSYGQTGNSNIGNKAKDFYQIAGTYVFGGKDNSAIGIGQMGNPALKWETTTEFNLGLDVSLYNRLDVSMEFYSREIKDLLSTRSLMSYQEVGSIAANVGKTQSKGFELTIGSKNIVKPNFSWSTDITFSLYRDRWKERDSSWKPAVYESAKDFIRSGFGYKADGLIQPGEEVKHMPGSLPGQIKIQDIDGYQKNAQGQNVIGDDGRPLRTGKPDGKLDNADKVFYGSWDPGYLFGMNNTFTYKNWDLNFYIYGAADQLMNGSYKDWNESQRIATYYGAPTTFMDSWTSQNLTSGRPGYFQTDSAHGAGDYFMKKIWYIRVRNITLGYSIPTKWSKGVLSGARVYFDVNNPFLFTNYKGIDPETDGWAGGLAAYPNVRTFSIGLDLTF